MHNTVENGPAKLWPGDLATTEEETDFDLVALFEELAGAAKFYLEIMLTDLEPEPDLLYLNLLLILPAFGQLFRLLVAVFAPIEDFYHRRLGVGSYFCQIQTRFGCDIERLSEGNDATLRTIGIDQTNSLGSDITVQADFVDL
jgi:hypothetical protein